ncbi:hypothetical protein ACIOEX_21010 [Streptomyces sp. NPDC087850]|uniref:hypothetical protein n=1 Tax=Streptomyces sp. NPDC087850 TaxID=3365809 RepID=UPI0038130526
MPEDPLAQGEIAALTRRYEQHAAQTNDSLTVIKSDVLHLRLEVGANTTRLDGVETRLDGVETRLDGVETRLDGVETRLDGVETRLDGVETRLGAVETKIDGLGQKIDHNQAQIVELLTRLVGKDPNAA